MWSPPLHWTIRRHAYIFGQTTQHYSYALTVDDNHSNPLSLGRYFLITSPQWCERLSPVDPWCHLIEASVTILKEARTGLLINNMQLIKRTSSREMCSQLGTHTRLTPLKHNSRSESFSSFPCPGPLGLILE